jgi:hypothetical protein
VAGVARFVTARAALWLLRLKTRRLDAPERAAKLVNLTLVSDFLALGQFDQFEDFIQLVNRVLERLGNFSGVRDGLADGRSFSGMKIGGLDPRLGARRFRAAFGPAVARMKFTRLRGRRTDGFRFVRSFSERWRFLQRHSLGLFFGMRFAEIAGGVGLVFRSFGLFDVNSRFFGRVRRGWNFLGGDGRFGGCRARTTATASATATAASGWAARGGGRVQVGMFVRHKFQVRMAVRRAKAMAN